MYLQQKQDIICKFFTSDGFISLVCQLGEKKCLPQADTGMRFQVNVHLHRCGGWMPLTCNFILHVLVILPINQAVVTTNSKHDEDNVNWTINFECALQRSETHTVNTVGYVYLIQKVGTISSRVFNTARCHDETN